MRDGKGATAGVLVSYGGKNVGDEAILTAMPDRVQGARTPARWCPPAPRTTAATPARASGASAGRT